MLYYVMVTEQEYLPKLSSGSSSMLSASVYRHGSADMAVFMYSDGAEVGVRTGYKLPKETCINLLRRT